MDLVIDAAGLERIATLAPPANLRGRGKGAGRRCHYCKHLLTDGEITYCVRPDGPVFETGDSEALYTVCDGWKDITSHES